MTTTNGNKSFLKRDLSISFGSGFRKKMTSASKTKSAPKPKPTPKASQTSSSTRHKQVVGLKIGSSQLAAAVVTNNGSPKLTNAVRQDIEPGLVVGGEVREPEALAAALDAFFSRHNLPRRKIRVGLGSNRVGVRIFERPAVDDPKQLANAIRFRAHEALPIPIEEAMLDYHVLNGGDGPGRVVLAVTYRELVDRFVSACQLAKLELIGIDLEAFAVLRALGAPAPQAQSDGARVAVSIGHDRTTVAVSDGQVCEFTRVLDWGGAKLTSAIERSLRVEPAEAEKLKRSVSLTGGAERPEGADAVANKATAAVRREVQSLARELGSTLEFYQDQPSSLSFASVSVTGGTSHLKGLDTELGKLLGIDVAVADPFARVGGKDRAGSAGPVGSLAVAIGLGIED